MSKKQLRKDEIAEFDRIIHEKYKLEGFFNKKKVELEDEMFLLVDGEQSFIKIENNWIPSLKSLQKTNFLKTVTIDIGAVKFVCSGADVMRPGIVAFDTVIQKDDLVLIVDVTHKKPLAIGRMLMSGNEAQMLQKGKIIQNLHYVGDEWWKKNI